MRFLAGGLGMTHMLHCAVVPWDKAEREFTPPTAGITSQLIVSGEVIGSTRERMPVTV